MTTRAYDKLSRVDFRDGHAVAVAWNGWTLLLDYENWQAQILRLKFNGVAHVSGYGGGASLCDAIVSCDSPEIERVTNTLSEDWGSQETWNGRELTQLVISDDVPLLTIIFEDVEIELLSDLSDSINSKIKEFDNPDT